MIVFFDIHTETDDLFRVTLSSGEDAFFATAEVLQELKSDIDIIEIDLERIRGTHNANLKTLRLIADRIGQCFQQNEKAALYYYCDEMELPIENPRRLGEWPQEYRSQLFSSMFKRYVQNNGLDSIADVTIMIMQGNRPIYMHLIARECHQKQLESFKNYISKNYEK